MIRTDAAGERTFLHWRDSAPVRGLFHLPEIAAIEDNVARAGLIYFSGITLSLFDAASRDRLFALLARARAAGGRVAFDTNFRPRGWPDREIARDAYARAFAHADVVFLSVEDHVLLHGPTSEEAALAYAQRFAVAEIVLKFDTPVCRVVTADLDERVAAPPVPDVADTTAAGDSFAAAYLAARRGGADPAVAAAAGHRLAGVVVRHRGAIIPRAAMPAILEAS
jgi:2-dehydro-3-deoxygluconokinase